MLKQNRPLSLAGLRGFLAAARQLSFTLAARELNLTQSALSRQIQGIEDEIGRPLFRRLPRRLELTEAGLALRDAASRGLREIDGCVARLRAPVTHPRIAVTTFASFASLWLIPRLAGFAASHPETDVICAASDRMVDLDGDGFDLALRCTGTRLGPPDHLPLFDEIMVPVCSPGFLAAHGPLQQRADLDALTLLCPDEPAEQRFPWLSWPHWLAQAGCPAVRGRSLLRFTNHDQTIQAALAGQGVALARAAMIGEQLRGGQLRVLFNALHPTGHSYYLVSSARSRQRPEVREFMAWIEAEAVATRAHLAALANDNSAQ